MPPVMPSIANVVMNVGSRARIAIPALVTPAAMPAQIARMVERPREVGADHQHGGDRSDERLDRRDGEIDLAGDEACHRPEIDLAVATIQAFVGSIAAVLMVRG